MRILAIETSCDETAIAIIETEGVSPHTQFKVLANQTLTQIELHRQYGGVFPMMAKREHAKSLVPLLKVVLQEAGLFKESSRHVVESPLRAEFQHMLEREPELYAKFITQVPNWNPPPIDMIAVTSGPGLEPALWVGINFAKALGMVWKMPVLPINHMEGHMLAPLLTPTESGFCFAETALPLLGLLVSGGHTELVLSKEWGSYELIGETKDDAVGEAFDKVARILGLPYPGGPEIAKLALEGTAGKYTLPRPMIHADNFDFSFSGLKTAVLYLVRDLTRPNFEPTPRTDTNYPDKKILENIDKNLGGQASITQAQKADIARDFEDACAEVLTKKTVRACQEYGIRTVVVGGGVSANLRLKEVLNQKIKAECDDVVVHFPSLALATDNALMIAIAAATKDPKSAPLLSSIKANGNWRITSA